MALYCLTTEPYIDKQFPNTRKWVIVTKDYPKPKPENGKKKISKEKNDEYKDMMERREKMFKQLDTGHYNCFNQPVEGEDIVLCANNIFCEREDIYYRINPTACKVTSERYSYSTHHYPISEFDVINKCDTTEKLLLQLAEDNCLNEFLARAFDSGHCINRQESYKKILKFCKENIKDYAFCLGNIVTKENYTYDKVPRFGTGKYELTIEGFVKELISEGLMLLHSWSDYYEKQTFTFLLRMNWFDLALNYIKTMNKENFDPLKEVILQDNNFKLVETILKTNNNNESVKEIIKFLDFKPSTITVKVYSFFQDWDDDYIKENEPKDEKEFDNIDEVKNYLISEYKIPFSKLIGDISKLEYWKDDYDRIYITIE